MSIDYVFQGKEKDLGGFIVKRLLPMVQKRQVGPFVFIDHMGPFQVEADKKLDVRPHPHIGLATVTYLFSGEAFHADSLGSRQRLKPGAINLMIAGSGIAHSERTPADMIASHALLHGLQIWLALPKEFEDMPAEFHHHGSESLPVVDFSKTTQVKILIGQFEDVISPVKTFSKTIFYDVKMSAADKIVMNFDCEEIGLYPIEGEVSVGGVSLKAGHIAILNHGGRLELGSSGPARFVILGGSPLPEKRYMWWNFVSSEKEKIKAAAEKWKAGHFAQVAGETDQIPLPDESYLKL
jgi:redox-sensitive bicupin YhaK (pirin superfamily)